jgi:hypothetical protein
MYFNVSPIDLIQLSPFPIGPRNRKQVSDARYLVRQALISLILRQQTPARSDQVGALQSSASSSPTVKDSLTSNVFVSGSSTSRRRLLGSIVPVAAPPASVIASLSSSSSSSLSASQLQKALTDLVDSTEFSNMQAWMLPHLSWRRANQLVSLLPGWKEELDHATRALKQLAIMTQVLICLRFLI